MFDKEFYPTPRSVLEMMDIDCKGKTVLEPSAGKGDIVDFLKDKQAKSVLAYEQNRELRMILTNKCRMLGYDFFECKAEDVGHIDLIVMNPPFSNADKHILHAFEIAPEGCEIIALCNWETNVKAYRYTELNKTIDSYGTSDNLGSCFDSAERKTNVEVGLIKLYKPLTDKESSFDGFFMDEEEEHIGGDGVMQFDEVRALVNRYVGTVKLFDEMHEINTRIGDLVSPLGIGRVSYSLSYNDTVTTKEEYAKYIQKVSWNYIFNKMNLSRFVTSGVMKDINTFVERQTQIPFTMKNIYRMFEIIVGTREETFNRALEEAIDNFTKYTDENRFGVEGWKTNSGYMLNRKFIVDWMVEPKWGDTKKVDLKISSYSHQDKISDLQKVMCNITGSNYDEETTLRDFFHKFNGLESGKWYSWSFWEFKVFKKGTMHLKFQNKDDWYKLNKAYGELKGFTLPEKI